MRRLSFLRGPMPKIGVGLALVVLSGLAFVALVKRSGVDEAGVSSLVSLYFLINTIALGVFSGVEQEMSRSVSQERAVGRAAGPIAHAVARQAFRLFLLTTALVLLLSPVLVNGPFHGHWELVAELIVGLFATCCASAVRGALAGSQRFGMYAATLSVEGLARLAPFVVLTYFGADSVWSFGLAFVLGQLFAALVGVALFWRAGDRRRSPIPPPAARIEGAGKTRLGISAGLALLVVASLTNQAVVNLPPVVIAGKLLASPELATAIAASIMLTRLPMFAFVPLQTMLLPRLTETAARGDRLGVRRQTVRTVLACVALGGLGILLLGTVGPQLLEIYLREPSDLSRGTMAGLGVGTLFLMTANVTQPALLALGKHRTVLAAYLSGAAAMVVMFVLPVDAVTSAVLSASGGPVVVAIVMAVALSRATNQTVPTVATAEQPAQR